MIFFGNGDKIFNIGICKFLILQDQMIIRAYFTYEPIVVRDLIESVPYHESEAE
jgi:hypothetical protein